MTLWLAINSIALLILAVALYVMLRQIGAMLAVLGPVGPRSHESEGPRLGESLKPWVSDLHGEAGQALPTLYVFAAVGCPACGAVREAANLIAPHWRRRADIVFVYDTDPGNSYPIHGPAEPVRAWSHSTLRNSMRISMIPFGIMTDLTGVVIDQGLVNRADHLEEMLARGERSPQPVAD